MDCNILNRLGRKDLSDKCIWPQPFETPSALQGTRAFSSRMNSIVGVREEQGMGARPRTRPNHEPAAGAAPPLPPAETRRCGPPLQPSCRSRDRGAHSQAQENRVDQARRMCIRDLHPDSPRQRRPVVDPDQEDKENQGGETQGQQPPQHQLPTQTPRKP